MTPSRPGTPEPPPRLSHRTALRHLRSADPKLARVIESVGRCTWQPRAEGTHFHALVRAIVYQQLSGRAAATIHARVLGLFGDAAPEPRHFLDVTDESLRAAGLSRQKITYIRDLAARSAAGELPLDRVEQLTDAEIELALCNVKGVGRWTAQMFLMFRLGRPDVLPETDLGIRKGVMKAYRLRAMPTPERVRKIGAAWSPHASVASWYMWRVLETE